jgi:DsbC/DsbD-like thiol-disulfide interchange protein
MPKLSPPMSFPTPLAVWLASALAFVFAIATVQASGPVAEVGIQVGDRIAGVAPAQTATPPAATPRKETGESLVSTDLVALDRVIEPGKPFALGVRFTIAPKWHIYWKNPGDSGGPPGIIIEAPKGFSIGEVEYPRPIVLEKPEEVTIGYERQVIYRVMITPPASFDGLPPAITLVGKLDWMVCRERCLMGEREVKVELPLNAPIPAELTATAGEFPVPAAELGITASLDGETLIINVPTLAKGRSIRFIPDVTPGVSYGATVPAAVTADAGGATIRIPLTVKPQNALGQPLRAAGLVALTNADGASAGSAAISIHLAPNPATQTQTGGAIR